MELFGFSAAKIIALLIIAIVIFGPDKVPEMARTVGRTVRDLRRFIGDMSKDFNDATGGLKDEFTAITQDLREELEATQADLRGQLDLTGILNTQSSAARHPERTIAHGKAIDADAPPTEALPAELSNPGPSATSRSLPPDPAASSEIIAPVRAARATPTLCATKANLPADLTQRVRTASRADDMAAARRAETSSGAEARGGAKKIGGSVAGTRYIRARSGRVPSPIAVWQGPHERMMPQKGTIVRIA